MPSGFRMHAERVWGAAAPPTRARRKGRLAIDGEALAPAVSL